MIQATCMLVSNSTMNCLPGLRYHLFVGEIFSDSLEFTLIKYFGLSLWHIQDPGMINNLFHRKPLARLRLKKSPNKIFEVSRQLIFPLLFLKSELRFDDHLMKILHVIRFERYSSKEHCIETHAQAPNIRRETFVALSIGLLATN